MIARLASIPALPTSLPAAVPYYLDAVETG